MEHDKLGYFDAITSRTIGNALKKSSVARKIKGIRAHFLEVQLLRRLLETMGRPPLQVVLWTGEEICLSASHPVARMAIHDRASLLKLVMNPELHFGHAYSSGQVEVEGDLVAFLEAVYRGLSVAGSNSRVSGLFHGLKKGGSNTLAGSCSNIRHHYDIGNEFYRLWLDEQMVYTCAYFATPSATLEEAQIAKMDHICRKLQLSPGETVVEAGCGWGSLARHMAGRYGVKAKAFNISREQIQYARERAKAEGLADRVEYIEDDYRNITGRFDALVSVGMLEHVGLNHYRELGRVIHRSLGKTGRGLIHSIGRNRAQPMNAWIDQSIFPGAYPPTLGEMMGIFEPWEFSVLDVENLRLHYAMTLRHWLARFEKAEREVKAMSDRRFVRTWRLYLAGSAAAFTTGDLQLFQILFAGPHNNDIPWTRAYLYEG